MMSVIKKMGKENLYKNAFWLTVNFISLSLFGFFFWTINTRLFSVEQVGLASTLIASFQLIMGISLLGFNVTLIRYLPLSKDKGRITGSCFIISGLVALIVSILFLLLIPVFSPEMIFVTQNPLFIMLFVLFSAFTTTYMLIESVFIAYRKSKFVFLKNLFFNAIRLILPFGLVFLGAFGIFSSWAIAAVVSLIISLFFMQIPFKLTIDRKIIRKILSFSSGNYAANLLQYAPITILPIMITSIISPAVTAYFYLAWMMATIIFFIPQATAHSLLVEGSHDTNGIRKKVKKAFYFSFLLVIPGAIIVFFTAKYLLLIFGKPYSENAFQLLKILAISSIPLTINTIYVSLKNIQHKIKNVIIVNLLIALGTIGGSVLMVKHGLAWIGVCWLSSHVLINFFVIGELITFFKNE